MPSPTPLVFQQGIHRGRNVYFRSQHILLKVVGRTDDEATVRATIDDVLDGIDYDIVGGLVGRWAYIRLRDRVDIPTLVKSLGQDPLVEYAEPDLRLVGSTGVVDPRDPLLYEGEDIRQWAVEFMNVAAVWEDQVGDPGILIGLIDSGVPLKSDGGPLELHDPLADVIDHVDLEGSRFIAGWDYLPDEPVVWPHDDHGLHHGTTMAGIIAAWGNNKNADDEYVGTAGINWGSPVYVAKALQQNNLSTVGFVRLAVAEILDYAADNGFAHTVLHLSVNYRIDDGDDVDGEHLATMKDMFDDIASADAAICISAGNGTPADGGLDIQQPARLAIETPAYAPYAVIVGAIDSSWKLYEFTCRGASDMVFAPGVDVATTSDGGWSAETGTSVANANVAGVLSLLWSEAPDLDAPTIVKCLKKTCLMPGDDADEDAASATDLGLGVVNAGAALQAIRGYAELLTPIIAFEDAAAGLDHELAIEIDVIGCGEVTFTVTVEGHGFGISEGTYAHDPCADGAFVLTAVYAAAAKDYESGTVTVVWDQKPTYRWEIPVTAERTAARTAICLVLDRSGSMAGASGVEGLSRMEVLAYSAGILVDLLEAGTGVGLVSFDSAASELAAWTVIPAEDAAPAREALKAAVAALEPGGQTSIAAGLTAARDLLDGVEEELDGAIVVLTDGRETHEPWLSGLTAADIPYPIYAVGMGTADALEPEGLTTLAGLTAGYAVLTGELDDAAADLIAEFLAQILADIAGDSVVYDPAVRLRPGTTLRFPLRLGPADRTVEIMLMRPPLAPVDCRLIDPRGRRLPDSAVTVTASERLLRVGLAEPARRRDDYGGAGTWLVEISAPRREMTDWIKDRGRRGGDADRMGRHGVRCTFRAHARSNIAMRCRVAQTGFAPGSGMTLRVRLTERGRPLRTRPVVTARLVDPDGAVRDVRLAPRGGDLYTADVVSSLPGIYRWLVRAEGVADTGHGFRRECRLTAAFRTGGPAGPVLPAAVPRPVDPSAWTA